MFPSLLESDRFCTKDCKSEDLKKSILINLEYKLDKVFNSISTVVKQLAHNPKIMSLNLVLGNGREKKKS
jgi:hypothetical protein